MLNLAETPRYVKCYMVYTWWCWYVLAAYYNFESFFISYTHLHQQSPVFECSVMLILIFLTGQKPSVATSYALRLRFKRLCLTRVLKFELLLLMLHNAKTTIVYFCITKI